MNKQKSNYEFMQNRELAWLRFNQRVLEEAQDQTVPILERLKFAAIFSSNLDEFFMIRVGSLIDLSLVDDNAVDNKTGMTPSEQLNKIYKAVAPLYVQKDQVYAQVIKKLAKYGIFELNMKNLEEKERKNIKTYFKRYIFPFLSPQIVDNRHPFPHLPSKVIHVVTYLEAEKNRLLGIIPVPEALPDIVFIPGAGLRYVHIEQIILEYAENIFEMYKVIEKTYLCITRNADITADDDVFDENIDFRHVMKKLLSKRRLLSVVRLEIATKISENLEKLFFSKFGINKNQMYITKSPMKMEYAFSLSAKMPIALKKSLSYDVFKPRLIKGASLKQSIMNQVKKQDYLISFPFESMDFFLAMIKEASISPAVVSVKITIYRLAQKTKLVEYLCDAAENGKDVTVFIELRARFDEQNNIDWSERLEEAGCTLIYGFDEYKLHSKICLITYKEKGVVKYMTQIGSGNYNERTAELYTDLSLITADQGIGLDAANFFKNMAIGNLDGIYRHLLVAPSSLKKRIIESIENEMLKGENGRIIMKLNSLTDKDVIIKLSEASCAGVKIDLIIRSICCLLPAIKEKTENITVTSVVGRFLEHSRIYSFGNEKNQNIFISSADLMTRNTQRRIEVACPIYDGELKDKINHLIEIILADNVKARVMKSNGIFQKKSGNEVPINSQEYFIEEVLNKSNIPKPNRSSHELFGNLKGWNTKDKSVI